MPEVTTSSVDWTSAPPEAGVTPGRLVLRRFLRHRLAVASGVLLVLLALASLAAPLVASLLGQDVDAVDLFNRFGPSSFDNPLGTDELGRDLLLRLLYGGRVSLFVGLVGAVAAATIGTIIGVVAGYAGGRVDAFLMRLTDAVIALPLLPLLIILAALDFTKIGLPAAVMRSSYGSLY
ncbi:MAG: ABC transporter permease, partial [Geminicoccaceae bacterium]